MRMGPEAGRKLTLCFLRANGSGVPADYAVWWCMLLRDVCICTYTMQVDTVLSALTTYVIVYSVVSCGCTLGFNLFSLWLYLSLFH